MRSALPIWRRPPTQLWARALLLWVGVLAVAVAAWGILLPFVLAALAAYVIDPVIARLTRLRVAGRRIPRWGAVVAVYLALAGLTWLGTVSIVPQVYREAMRALLQFRDFLASVTPERVDAWAAEIDAFLQRYGVPVVIKDRVLYLDFLLRTSSEAADFREWVESYWQLKQRHLHGTPA